MLTTTLTVTIKSYNLKQRDKMLKKAIRQFQSEGSETPLHSGDIHVEKESNPSIQANIQYNYTGRLESPKEKETRKAKLSETIA
jgi:hypothetical protein